jgi:hypothetical protein
MGKICQLLRRRNAYWGNVSRQWFHFGWTLEEVTEHLERAQGSVWTTIDHPAVIVCSDAVALILIHRHPDAPFEHIRPPRKPSLDLPTLASQCTGMGIEMFACPAAEARPARLPFVSSRLIGGVDAGYWYDVMITR